MQVNDGDDVQSLYRPVHACESLKAKEPIGWFGLTKFVELAASMHEELVFQNLDKFEKSSVADFPRRKRTKTGAEAHRMSLKTAQNTGDEVTKSRFYHSLI
ncbi:hypothetical protein [Oryza sativa Japonica Group]|uniref:Uncharacterized protein n=1 Tax=Oryza sativa subsp. japonica TaxID=39947 RepID=Q9FU19_ORYSJ|nr:hypothetical protein [Oryza sativa Japonica Group]